MTEEPPNIALLKRLDPRDVAAATGLFAEDVVWHYFNSNLSDLQGDHVGLDGIRSFLEALGQKSHRKAVDRSGLSLFRSRLPVMDWSSLGIGIR